MCSVNIGVRLMEGKPWKDRIVCLHRRASLSSSTVQLMGLLLSLVIWKLWVRSCKAQMKGVKDSVQIVWFSIHYWISRAALKIKAVRNLSIRDEIVLQNLNLTSPSIRESTLSMVKWRTP